MTSRFYISATWHLHLQNIIEIQAKKEFCDQSILILWKKISVKKLRQECINAYSLVWAKVFPLFASFLDSPKVFCNATVASLEDKGVHLRCELKAKPKYSSLRWVLDGNGTQLEQGQVSANYRVKVVVSAATLISR